MRKMMQQMIKRFSAGHRRTRPMNRRNVVESLEMRTLLSAVFNGMDFDTNAPVITLAGGQATYESSTGVLDMAALATGLIMPPSQASDAPYYVIDNPPYAGGILTATIKLNASGSFVQNVTDLVITGTASTPMGDFTSGTLLTGTATEFSFDNSGAQLQIGVKWHVTGGDLAPFWGSDDIAMIAVAEPIAGEPYFTGDFTVSFVASPKGNVGGFPTTSNLPAGLGDVVWYDKDHDGVQAAGEPGVNGVTVNLLDGSGKSTGLTTVTANNGVTDGYYQFTGLTPGSYQVQFVLPNGYTVTQPYQGGDTAKDSNASLTTGRSEVVTLAAGEFNPTIDAGIYLGGSITGKKYRDLTGNGLTCDDTALAGVTVKLYVDRNNNSTVDAADGAAVATTVTGNNGQFTFTDLAPGKYLVQEVVPTGYVRTAPTLTDTYVVNLSANQKVCGLDFANYKNDSCQCALTCVTYIINGCKVVTDLRGNTNQGDTVTVKFTLKSTQTLSFVSYTAPEASFVAEHAFAQNVYDYETDTFGPGTHTMTIKIPCSYYQIDFVCGTIIDRFGPADSNIFYSAQNRLISADNDGTKAATTGTGSLSGTVFIDTNGTKNYQSADKELGGIVITLTGYDSVLKKNITLTTTTDINGDYYFVGLNAGTYKITEGTVSAYKDGTDYAGTLGGTVSNDVISNIVLKAGQNGFNYNFGEKTA